MESQRSFSPGFLRLVKQVAEATSKEEEARIVRREITGLTGAMGAPTVSAGKMRDFLVRAMYCEMLGHSIEEAYIHAVKLTQEKNVLHKRIGYLAASLFLTPGHELIILLVHSVRRDLASTSLIEVCIALTAASLLSAEYIPAVRDAVLALFKHDSGMVRKKAVMAVHSFYQKDPEVVDGLDDEIRRVLCDPDPAVMAATLVLIDELIAVDKAGWVDLVPSFVSILKQVANGKLAPSFSYHAVPAPWIQIQLLRILGALCADNKRGSSDAYEVVKVAMHKADCGVFAGYAVSLEAVRTVATMYPNPLLLEMAAQMVSKFISSPNNNLKYVGITALAQIVALDPKYAAQHADIVMDSLDGDDETLKRKTLDLLFKMTNPRNVSAVVERLLAYLRSTVDPYLRTDLVSRISNLAERYAPSSTWYLRVSNLVFEYAPSAVSPAQLDDLLRLIAEGTGDDDADDELRAYAVSAYAAMIDRPAIPDLLVIAIAWTLGEYTYLSADVTEDEAMLKLVELARRPFEDPQTRAVIITALTKLVAQVRSVPPPVAALVDHFSNSAVLDIQQRCYEFKQLVADFDLMEVVLPVDAANEVLDVDPALPFLDAFVAAARASGAAPYLPPSARPWASDADAAFDLSALGGPSASASAPLPATTLRFDAYDNPLVASPPPAAAAPPPSSPLIATSPADGPPPVPMPAERPTLGGLSLDGLSVRWGATGLVQPTPAAPAADNPVAAGVPAAPTTGFVFGGEDDAESTTSSDEGVGGEPASAAADAATTADAPPPRSGRSREANALFAGTSGGSSLGLDQPVGVRIRRDRRPRGARGGHRAKDAAASGAASSLLPGMAPAPSPPAGAGAPSSSLLPDLAAPSSAGGAAALPSASASLLDIFGSPQAQPAPAPAPAPGPDPHAALVVEHGVQAPSSASLLDFGQPATPPRAATPPAPGGLLDLGGSSRAPAASESLLTGSGTSTPASPEPSRVFDFMSGAGASASAPASASGASALLPAESKGATGGRRAFVLGAESRRVLELASAPVPAGPEPCVDGPGPLVLGYAVTTSVAAVHFVVYLRNEGSVDVAGADVTFDVCPCFAVARGGDGGASGPVRVGAGEETSVVYALTASGQTEAVLSLGVNVLVTVDGVGKTIQVGLAVGDVVREHALATDLFGGAWIEARESEQTVSVGVPPPTQASYVGEQLVGLGLALDDLIGNEVILSGKFLAASLLLVHAKLDKTGSAATLTITVRGGPIVAPLVTAARLLFADA